MLDQMPAELAYITIRYLHAVDMFNLANATMCSRSTYANFTLPCLQMLRPLLEIAEGRAHQEMIFGDAQDIVNVTGQDLWDSQWTKELITPQSTSGICASRSMKPEHSTAFLTLDESLQWLPPVSDEIFRWSGSDSHLDHLGISDAQSLCAAAERALLTIPPSFLRFMSDPKLMHRLPHRFWMPDRNRISKASELIRNGENGYMIDFCHELPSEGHAYMWSLWLEPRGSHCVVRRRLPEKATVKSTAQLVGVSFELWLASTFFAHWKKCGVDFCSDAHWWLDKPLVNCLRRYVRYNCIA